MLESLLSEHHLVGMTREEVVALLGPSDWENRFGYGDLNYVLGPEEGFISIDMEWLTLDFKDGRVVDVRITRD